MEMVTFEGVFLNFCKTTIINYLVVVIVLSIPISITKAAKVVFGSVNKSRAIINCLAAIVRRNYGGYSTGVTGAPGRGVAGGAVQRLGLCKLHCSQCAASSPGQIHTSACKIFVKRL